MQAKPQQACFSQECFDLELAVTPQQRTAGLQFRKELAANRGMLFVFGEEEGLQWFWMKDTLITLDMIWLDGEGEVIFIQHSAPPCQKDPCQSYGPGRPAKYVLEFNGGTAKRLGLEEGGKVSLRL